MQKRRGAVPPFWEKAQPRLLAFPTSYLISLLGDLKTLCSELKCEWTKNVGPHLWCHTPLYIASLLHLLQGVCPTEVTACWQICPFFSLQVTTTFAWAARWRTTCRLLLTLLPRFSRWGRPGGNLQTGFGAWALFIEHMKLWWWEMILSRPFKGTFPLFCNKIY